MLVYIIQFSIFALIVGYVATGEYYTAFKTGVPPVTSFPAPRRKIVEILRQYAVSRAGASFSVIDLGSGNGRLSREIARNVPDARVMGLELSFFPWLRSVVRQKLSGPKNLAYRRVNFWPYDCSGADVVVVFLTDNLIERVSQKLRKELKPGTLVISNEVALPGWEPVETHDAGFMHFKIFVYRQS